MIVFNKLITWGGGGGAFEWLAGFGRDRTTLLLVVLAILGTAHILVRTASYGAAIYTDSTVFLSTAMNFLAGEGWRSFEGYPIVGWPPLFPLLLAAFGWVGIEPLEAGRWINAIAFGLTILAAGCWLRSNLRSWWLALAATATIAASLPLSELASSLMTEPLFVLLTLLALIQLAAFLNRKTVAPLWWAAVFTALAAITRYPGVVLILTGVLMLLLRTRLRHTLAFGAVSSLPLLAVLAYNLTTSKTLTGPRPGSGQSVSASLSQVVDVFRAWIVPPNALAGLAHLLWLAVAVVGLASAAVVLRSTFMRSNFRLEPALPFAAFALTYLVFIVVVLPFVIPVGIYSRFLLPIYVPLLLASVFLLDRFLSIKAGAVRYGLASLILLGALAHIGFSAYRNLILTAQARVAGYDYRKDGTYNVADWQQSATLKYVRTHLSEGRIYSNNPFLVWFGDRTAAIKKHRALPNKIRDWPQNARGWIRRGEAPVYIVWIKDDYRSIYYDYFYDYNDLDIRCLLGVDTVAELSDGIVFRVTAAEPFDAKRHRTRKQRYLEQLIEQASERVVRAGWDVYRAGRTLIYRKESCAPADVQAKFVLYVVPVDRADLPADRQQFGSDNLDFYFSAQRGFWVKDQCMVIAHLPAYAIGRIHIGQWISAENRTLWEAEFSGAGL